MGRDSLRLQASGFKLPAGPRASSFESEAPSFGALKHRGLKFGAAGWGAESLKPSWALGAGGLKLGIRLLPLVPALPLELIEGERRFAGDHLQGAPRGVANLFAAMAEPLD